MLYIKDLQTGKVRLYGTNSHDSLRISEDGTCLSYENLQNGDGSLYGEYRLCDNPDGLLPEENECVEARFMTYADIGGTDLKQRNEGEWLDEEFVAFHLTCNQCGCNLRRQKEEVLEGNFDYNFCPNCGSKMGRGGRVGETD